MRTASSSTPSVPRDPFSGLELLSEDANLSLGSMEAIDWTPPAVKTPSRLLGICLAVAVTLGAVATHQWLLKPIGIPFGPSVLAMLYGMVVANLLNVPGKAYDGLHWIVAALIPIAIVALGAGLDFSVLAKHGWAWFGLVLLAVILSLATAKLFGHKLGLSQDATLLIAAGTAICGSSAILAVAPLLKAKKESIIASVAAVNLIGIIAMAVCIAAGAVFPISAIDFGLWTGATIHAVPTVAGAAFDHSEKAGEIATLIKLGRVAMLAPLVVGFALWVRPRAGSAKAGKSSGIGKSLRLIPWFVVGFVVAALLNTFHLLPTLEFSTESRFLSQPLSLDAGSFIQGVGKALLALAMAAIGLQVSLKPMLATGRTAVLTACFAWIAVSGVVLTVILLL